MSAETTTNWSSDRLKDISAINLCALPANTADDFGFRYLVISNVNSHGVISEDAMELLQFADAPSRARRVVRKADVLVSSVRPNLQAIAHANRIDEEPLVCSTGFNVVSPRLEKIVDRFLYFFLLSEGTRQHFEAVAKGVGYPAIDDKDFCSTTIPLPPLPEQKRIAAYLDVSCAAIDRAVETKQKQLETLDALRKSIIQRAVTQGLNPKVKMKDSGTVHLGPVPQHWKVRRVKDVFEFHNHRRIPISSADRGIMTDRIYDYYGASGAIDKVEDYIFEGRYILLAEDGANLLTRSKQLAFFAEGKFWVNNHAHIIKPWRGNEIYWVNLLESQDYSLAVTGSAQPKLNMQNFGRFQIPVPPEAEQNEIADFVVRRSADCDKVKDTLSSQTTTLTAYRKSLIHECVTGKRRISDADVAKILSTTDGHR